MKRFMKENIITHNLMSFSAFKGILIFSMLVEKPCTYQEIQEAMFNNQYLKESIHVDTIRIYINSLKKIGCDVKTLKVGKHYKYYIENQPFELKITDKQIKAIIKVYKAISKSIDLDDYFALKSFFERISPLIVNPKLQKAIETLSPIKHLDNNLINQLRKCAINKNEITILYNSKTSGRKHINILVNDIYISNGKLYIAGINSEYNNYSSFLVSCIVKIVSINIERPKLNIPKISVQYEYKKLDNMNFELQDNEKIIDESDNKLIIEIESENKFMILQRILSLSNMCKVITPEFQQEVIACLKRMKEGYIVQK